MSPSPTDVRRWRKLCREAAALGRNPKLGSGPLKLAMAQAFAASIPTDDPIEHRLFWRLMTFARTFVACDEDGRRSNAKAFLDVIAGCAHVLGKYPDDSPPPPAAAVEDPATLKIEAA